MKNVIVLSTVLGLSALGMACGDSGTNVNVTAKPANVAVSTPAPVSTPISISTPVANAPANANKPAANAPASNMKPANAPVASPTKKP